MNYYYFNRGLDVVEYLAKHFKDRQWWLPDFICDEVLDTIFKYVDDFKYYQVNDDFSWTIDIKGESTPKIFYAIGYFGKELILGNPPNTIVIRDSVWMPKPFMPVGHNQIWFNSFRKIIRGAKGASVASPYRLNGLGEVPNLFNHHSLNWVEIDKRWNNYFALRDFMPFEHQVNYESFLPDFPTVFPVRLKNREKVLNQIEQPLPGMWQNKYKFDHPLYRELTFIPIDSRFDRGHVLKLAEQMVVLDGKPRCYAEDSVK